MNRTQLLNGFSLPICPTRQETAQPNPTHNQNPRQIKLNWNLKLNKMKTLLELNKMETLIKLNQMENLIGIYPSQTSPSNP